MDALCACGADYVFEGTTQCAFCTIHEADVEYDFGCVCGVENCFGQWCGPRGPSDETDVSIYDAWFERDERSDV